MTAATAKKTSTAPSARKPARQAAAKVATKPSAKPLAKPVVKPVAKAAPEPADKPRKPKLVRDSFTIPKAEYAAIDRLKQRAAQAGHTAKKSELLRAGLMALDAMNSKAFLAALRAVPAIKTGRPAKD